MDDFHLENLLQMIEKSSTLGDGKEIIKLLVSMVSDLSKDVEELKEKLSDTLEYAELLEQDMDTIKEELFGEGIFEGIEEEDDYKYTEVKCDNCHESIYVEEELLKEKLHCPNCDKELLK